MSSPFSRRTLIFKQHKTGLKAIETAPESNRACRSRLAVDNSQWESINQVVSSSSSTSSAAVVGSKSASKSIGKGMIRQDCGNDQKKKVVIDQRSSTLVTTSANPVAKKRRPGRPRSKNNNKQPNEGQDNKRMHVEEENAENVVWKNRYLELRNITKRNLKLREVKQKEFDKHLGEWKRQLDQAVAANQTFTSNFKRELLSEKEGLEDDWRVSITCNKDARSKFEKFGLESKLHNLVFRYMKAGQVLDKSLQQVLLQTDDQSAAVVAKNSKLACEDNRVFVELITSSVGNEKKMSHLITAAVGYIEYLRCYIQKLQLEKEISDKIIADYQQLIGSFGHIFAQTKILLADDADGYSVGNAIVDARVQDVDVLKNQLNDFQGIVERSAVKFTEMKMEMERFESEKMELVQRCEDSIAKLNQKCAALRNDNNQLGLEIKQQKSATNLMKLAMETQRNHYQEKSEKDLVECGRMRSEWQTQIDKVNSDNQRLESERKRLELQSSLEKEELRQKMEQVIAEQAEKYDQKIEDMQQQHQDVLNDAETKRSQFEVIGNKFKKDYETLHAQLAGCQNELALNRDEIEKLKCNKIELEDKLLAETRKFGQMSEKVEQQQLMVLALQQERIELISKCSKVDEVCNENENLKNQLLNCETKLNQLQQAHLSSAGESSVADVSNLVKNPMQSKRKSSDEGFIEEEGEDEECKIVFHKRHQQFAFGAKRKRIVSDKENTCQISKCDQNGNVLIVDDTPQIMPPADRIPENVEEERSDGSPKPTALYSYEQMCSSDADAASNAPVVAASSGDSPKTLVRISFMSSPTDLNCHNLK